ncbi:hypothetical protein CQ14_37595 [Bradyrhizobium lablabi]|uniref:Uncharacterized protein n=1 Tax=Bradyrhizobium lablabi TaxID=722472 RepID=A0A0R3MD21_9BRAD|nr:hypothetical protein CQ14_37595 [Bradyrhizobium lablabi]
MILSANDSRTKKLVQDVLALRESRLTYASGNLVLWSRMAKFVNGSDTLAWRDCHCQATRLLTRCDL